MWTTVIEIFKNPSSLLLLNLFNFINCVPALVELNHLKIIIKFCVVKGVNQKVYQLYFLYEFLMKYKEI